MKVADKFVCWGASGHALVMQDILAEQGAEIVAYIDLFSPSVTHGGKPVFRAVPDFERWLHSPAAPRQIRAVIAIGRQGPDRLNALAQLHALGVPVPVLVASSASISPQATLGEGCQVLPMAVVASGARLGNACIVNHHAVVDHECRLGDGVHIAPGATVCGCVSLGDDVFVGAGAVVLPRIHVGSGAMIGAGAVVTHDVSPGTVVTGNPAR